MATGHYVTGTIILVGAIWLFAFVCNCVWQDRKFAAREQEKDSGK